MGLGRIGGYVFVALASILLTFYWVRVTNGDTVRCDIHPKISTQGLAALKNNLERARAAAHSAVLADKHDEQAAYRAEEQSAEDEFVHDLHEQLAAEYRRHRQALDGCF